MKKELVCITCPMSCHLEVTFNDHGEVLEVTGNSCKRGEIYAKNEFTNPKRMLTSVVRIKGGIHPMLPVITSSLIPKDKISFVMEKINKVEVEAPVKINDVIIKNVIEGIDIIASRSMDRK